MWKIDLFYLWTFEYYHSNTWCMATCHREGKKIWKRNAIKWIEFSFSLQKTVFDWKFTIYSKSNNRNLWTTEMSGLRIGRLPFIRFGWNQAKTSSIPFNNWNIIASKWFRIKSSKSNWFLFLLFFFHHSMQKGQLCVCACAFCMVSGTVSNWIHP